MDDTGPIILFDALCVLCSANAQFILRHDRRRRFRIASIQGDVGRELCGRFGIDPVDPDTIIVVTGDHALRDSNAVLAIYAGLGWPWRSASVLRVIPRGVRDPLYRLIARNRYRLFGRRQVCWRPSPEDAGRVI